MLLRHYSSRLKGNLRNHNANGNSNYNAMLLLFQNFKFKRFLVFCSNFSSLESLEVVLFNFTTWKPYGVLYSRSGAPKCEVTLTLFEYLSSKKKYGFQASLCFRRPHFALLDDILKVAHGHNNSFPEYQMTFCCWHCHPGFVKSLMCRINDGIEVMEYFLLHCHSYHPQRSDFLNHLQATLLSYGSLNLSKEELVSFALYGDERLPFESNKATIRETLELIESSKRLSYIISIKSPRLLLPLY